MPGTKNNLFLIGKLIFLGQVEVARNKHFFFYFSRVYWYLIQGWNTSQKWTCLTAQAIIALYSKFFQVFVQCLEVQKCSNNCQVFTPLKDIRINHPTKYTEKLSTQLESFWPKAHQDSLLLIDFFLCSL